MLTLQGFCLNGLQDVVDVDLDLSCLKIVEKGMVGISRLIDQVPKIPKVLVTNIKQLMLIEKAGVAAQIGCILVSSPWL